MAGPVGRRPVIASALPGAVAAPAAPVRGDDAGDACDHLITASTREISVSYDKAVAADLSSG
jgi:hypothetical protein